ncbi:MAG: hypothetical protein ACI3XP_04430 [Eubacteriales bacterium]
MNKRKITILACAAALSTALFVLSAAAKTPVLDGTSRVPNDSTSIAGRTASTATGDGTSDMNDFATSGDHMNGSGALGDTGNGDGVIEGTETGMHGGTGTNNGTGTDNGIGTNNGTGTNNGDGTNDGTDTAQTSSGDTGGMSVFGIILTIIIVASIIALLVALIPRRRNDA